RTTKTRLNRRPAAGPCSSACRTSRAARPRSQPMRLKPITGAIRSTFRASSTARTTSKPIASEQQGRSPRGLSLPFFALTGLLKAGFTHLAAFTARLIVKPLGRKGRARFSAARGGSMRGLLRLSLNRLVLGGIGAAALVAAIPAAAQGSYSPYNETAAA